MRLFKKISQFSKSEIDVAFKRAHGVLKHDGLTVLCAPAQKEYGRILIIASKKVGNAPQRNRLRRQFKNIFFENKLWETKQDTIVILRAAAKDIPFAFLQEFLLKAVKK